MAILSDIRSLLVPSPCMAVAAEPALASRAGLDGRNFDGIVLECGRTSGDADTLIFKDGRFRSTACDQYGYGDGPDRPKPRVRSTASCSGRAWCGERASTAR
jgi:hypothetical protein